MRPLEVDGLMGQQITLALVHAVWMGLAVAAVVALILPGRYRLAPEIRYRGMLLAFATVVIGPWAVDFLPRVQSVSGLEPSNMIATVSERSESSNTGSSLLPAPFQKPAPWSLAPATPIQVVWSWCLAILIAGARCYERIQPYLLRGWLAGVGLLMLRLALAGISFERLRAAACPGPALMENLVTRLGNLLKLRTACRVLVHDRLDEPIVGGLIWPTILLPSAWANSLTPAQLEAILAHELAHIRRLDLPVNLIQRVAETLLFFHPALRWLSARVRVERERCTDVLAVSVTGDPLALAQALESLARARWNSSQKLTLAAPLGGGESSLLPRLQELLGMKPTRTRLRLWPLVALPCAAGFAVLAGSLGLAQEPTPPAQPQAKRPPDLRRATVPVLENVQFEFVPGPSQTGSEAGGKRASTKGGGPQGVFEVRSIQLKVASGAMPTPVKVDAKGNPKLSQIAFEVRFLEVDPALFQDDEQALLFTPVNNKSGVQTLILDDAATQRLMRLVQSSPRSIVLQAPKVTAFEGITATISNQQTQYLVTGLQPIIEQGIAFKPTVEKYLTGIQLAISARLPDPDAAIRLNVQLTDLELGRVESMAQEATDGNHTIRAAFQIPHPIERAFEAPVELKNGQTLVINLGAYPRTLPRQSVFWKALGLLRYIGIPALDTEHASIDKFVLITPRPIVIEQEEAALGRQPVVDPAVVPTSGQSAK